MQESKTRYLTGFERTVWVLAGIALFASVLLTANAGTGYDASPLASPLPYNFVRWLAHCESETGWHRDCCIQAAYCAWGYEDDCSWEARAAVCSPDVGDARAHTLYLPIVTGAPE